MQLRLMEAVGIGYLEAEADRVRWNWERREHPNCGWFVCIGIGAANIEVTMAIQPFGGTQ
jgi:hypothetical protein